MRTSLARVSGRGVFPIDMLRYDKCYPSTGVDVNHVTKGMRTLESIEEREVEVVQRYEGDHPNWTPARWLSFGWRIEEIS